jgi:hypothetical protein
MANFIITKTNKIQASISAPYKWPLMQVGTVGATHLMGEVGVATNRWKTDREDTGGGGLSKPVTRILLVRKQDEDGILESKI